MQRRTKSTTRTISYCAMLTALSVVFARLLGLMPNESIRFSIEAVPIFLAGLLLGPLPGAMVGFTADFVGCLFSAFGYNPIFCIPPILYGVIAGLFRHYMAGRGRLLWLAVSFLAAAAIGSVGYQSWALAYVYYFKPDVAGSLQQGLIYFLSTRAVQFAVTAIIDISLIYLLLQLRVFDRLGLWPPKERRGSNHDDR